MATSQSRRYTIYIDNAEAQRNLDSLKERARRLTDEISRIQAAGGNATRQMQQLGNTQQQITSLETSIRSGLTRSLRDLQGEVSRTENLLRRATDPETIRQLNAQLVTARQNLLQYRAGVLGIGSAQAQLAAQSANVFTRLRDGIKASLFGNLMAQGIALAIGMAVNFLSELKQITLAAEGIRAKFNQLNDPNLLKNLREATKGTVSDLELMKKAVQASNFQIPLETLGTLLNFARVRARETGEDLNYLTNSVITGISRKSTLILDNLGITASRIQDEFKKTGDFAKAVTNIIQEEMAKSGKYVEKYADSVARLGAWWDNVKLKTATALTDSADDFAYMAAKIRGEEEKMMEIAQRRVESFARNQEYGKRFQDLELKHLEEFKRMYSALTEDQQRDVLAITKSGLAETEKAQREALQDGNWKLATNLTTRLNIWNNYFQSLNKKQDENKVTLSGMQSELDILTKQLQELDIHSPAFGETQQAIKKLQKEIDDANGKTADQAAEKAKRLAEKDQRQKEQLIKQLEDFINKYSARQLSAYDKEIFESETRYNKLREQLIKYGVDTKKLDETQMQERIQLYQKYSGSQAAQYGRTHDLIADTPQAKIKKGQADTAARLMADIDQFTKDTARRNKDDVDAAELAVMTTHGKKQYEARKALLAAQRKQELDNVNLTANERAKIDADYQQKDWDNTTAYIAQKVDQYTQYLSGILSVYEQWSSAKKLKEDKELAADKELNDKKKEEYKRQLDAKIISQEDYARKVEALDNAQTAKERALKKKQFEREKVANITKAVMGTAQAVVQALTVGWPLAPVLAALTAAMGAAQIGIIAAQKAPEYGKGGKMTGPTHNSPSNGLPIYNPETGRPVAYVEGGEGILKRSAMSDGTQYTATGTISQIASMFNSMHGGVNWERGASVKPAWMSYTPKPVNFGAVTSTISNLRAYANGGVFASDTRQNTPANDETVVSIDPQLQVLLTQNMQVLLQLEQRLAGGITAIASINQINTEQQRMETIRSNSTFQA